MGVSESPKAQHKIGRFLIRKVRLKASLTSLAETLPAETLDDRRTNLERLQSLVNASPVAMYTCRVEGDFTTTFVTEGVRTLWGYEPSDFLHDPRFWTAHLHPEDAPRVLGQLSRVLEQGRLSYDYRFRVKSGEYRWTHDDMRLVRDRDGNPLEIAGYCFDITEQKLAEAALRESEARQKVIFNSTSDLQTVFRVESGNTFVTEAVNRAMAENLRTRMGHDGNDFIGKDFAELLAATGLATQEIELRRSLYRQVIEQRTTVRFDTPPSELRDALEVSVSPVMDQQENCTHLLWNGRNISKRIKAEAGLRESQERYALVTEAIHEGIFDWNLLTGDSYLSPRYKEILGFRDDELPNDTASFFGRIHPEDRARMLETKERYNEDPTKDRFLDELRLQHRDGTYRWVVSRGRIVRGAQGAPVRIVGAIGDLTDRLESAADLAASEKRLRDILNSLLGFVGLFTPDGKLIDCNDSSLEDARLKPQDVLGKLFWDTPGWRYDPEERVRVRDMMMRAAQGEVVRFETAILDVDERRMIIDFTFRPLRDQSGTVRHIIGHAVDITQRTQAEAELLKAKEAAESSSRAKSEFLANMSHEIRTPMNGVIGLTEVLLDTNLDPEQREYLTLVQSSAASLLTIINDILDVSKIEAGKLSLETEDLDLREVVLDALRGLRVSAESKGLSLVSDVAPGVPALVRGDPGRLRQILINLVGNAIKFTSQGQVAVAIKRSPDSADALHFSVRDTGIGIPAEKQAMIFEAFTQVDGSFTRRFGGTGLGLTIASRLVRMMHGRIWVESQEGQGSTFHFTARLEPT
jgi:two-component system, sensor histidine kinase and response regulator